MTELIKMDGLDKALIGRSCIWDSTGRIVNCEFDFHTGVYSS